MRGRASHASALSTTSFARRSVRASRVVASPAAKGSSNTAKPRSRPEGRDTGYAPTKAAVSQPCCRRIEARVGVPAASGAE